jgi:hypothetical protein
MLGKKERTAVVNYVAVSKDDRLLWNLAARIIGPDYVSGIIPLPFSPTKRAAFSTQMSLIN